MILYWFVNFDTDYPDLKIDWTGDKDNYRGIVDQLAAQMLGWA